MLKYSGQEVMYITVYEKAVIGYIRYMGCNMYFDKDGIVVESSTETFEKVPEIIGLKFKFNSA